MLPKVKKINLSSQLIDTMTTLIEENNWSPGSKLPNEVELAASLGVSRNIMREAMKYWKILEYWSRKQELVLLYPKQLSAQSATCASLTT